MTYTTVKTIQKYKMVPSLKLLPNPQRYVSFQSTLQEQAKYHLVYKHSKNEAITRSHGDLLTLSKCP